MRSNRMRMRMRIRRGHKTVIRRRTPHAHRHTHRDGISTRSSALSGGHQFCSTTDGVASPPSASQHRPQLPRTAAATHLKTFMQHIILVFKCFSKTCRHAPLSMHASRVHRAHILRYRRIAALHASGSRALGGDGGAALRCKVRCTGR